VVLFARISACIVAMIGLNGCSNSSNSNNNITTVMRADGGQEGGTTTGSSGELAQTIYEIFNLQRLDLETDAKVGVQDLNRLMADSSGNPVLLEPMPAALEKLLKPEELEQIREKRFTEPDGEHLRSAMLFKTLNEHAVGDADSSRKQVANLFDFVVSSIDLVPTSEALPLTAYEVCLTGRGSARDRAWIFAGLLRHLKIDSVLLLPTSSDPREPFLMGVLLKEENQDRVYLFDPAGGVPLRVAGKPDGNLATLEQALQDPAVLAALTGSDGQPLWTAENLAKAQVALIGSAPLWSGRMAQLQGHFTGTRSLALSDPLQETEQVDGAGKLPGYFHRVTTVDKGRFKEKSFSLWMYPEAVRARRKSLDASRKQAVDMVLGPRLCPIRTRRNEKGLEVDDPNTGFVQMHTPTRIEWRARLSQISGDFPKAITEYTQVRLASKFAEHTKLDPVIRAYHERAMEDVRFFIGLCQFQQGKTKEAAHTLGKYQTTYPEGIWANSARRHLALCLADQGAQDKAVETLKQFSEAELKSVWVQQHLALWSKSR